MMNEESSEVTWTNE